MMDSVTPSILISVQSGIEVFAVIAFALSGLAAGLRVGMDLVGICFVAGVSAFGGGTLPGASQEPHGRLLLPL